MSTELFELCRSVYAKVGWEHTKESSSTNRWYTADGNIVSTHSKRYVSYPLYTSDYLLEKLPKGVTVTHFKDLSYIKRKHEWSARMTPALGRYATADTPLKALLKLTIALHDAGELK
jgi:hypothetical protein